MIDLVLTWSGWMLCGLLLVVFLPSVWSLQLRRFRRLTEPLPPLAQWPRLTVIVPARDEEREIEAALRSLLRSNYPNLEIMAVDDRSLDRTGDIMDQLAAEDSRLKVTHIRELPEGWLGKNNALHQAALNASGEWILFTDGDIKFAPDTLALSVTYAAHHRLDHLCLMPGIVPGGYLENALVGFFSLMFMLGVQPWLVTRPFKRFYAGVGAFNLVRAAAYRSAGGHEPIRMDVLDDLKLGKLMKHSGGKPDVLLGGDSLWVRWQPSAWGVVRGLEKNAFASVNYSLPLLVLLSFAGSMLFLLPYAMVLLWPGVSTLGFAASAVLLHLVYGYLGSSIAGGWRILPMFPVAALILLFAFWRSAFITLKRGGVSWRGTLYPLPVLRKSLY